MKVLIKRLLPNAVMPEYKTVGSSGFDISACIEKSIEIPAKSFSLIRTGLALELPEDYEAQVRSRSGLALKNGVFVLNSPGTIDNDYRGEISVVLANFSDAPFVVENSMRIAQMVIVRYQQFEIEEVQSLTDTVRGSGGFGSTGLK